MFENFEHVSGFDEVLFDIRVRKINRTTMALNGSMVLKVPIQNDLRVSMDLFHSRLGNQQFNHYPMKLPTSGYCDFIDNIYTDYQQVMEQIENIPAKGECPISLRSIIFRDLIFPSEMIPLTMPRGLWKVIMIGERSGKMVYTYHVLVKVYDELSSFSF
uniref:Uncharacterized protein n=1 Tax=Anopheles atroparvus TaxID=41427 RepID=A0A182IQR7_ANOAO